MSSKLKIVTISSDYCNYLRLYDNKVPYNMNEKENRPFVGVLFKVDNLNYFAPMSSPKKKHLTMKNTIDFLKLDFGRLGAINFNNMIPVCEGTYELIDLKNKNLEKYNIKYLKLLNKQVYWLSRNEYKVCSKSYYLYKMYNDNKLPINIKDRCINFKLLEKYSKKYKVGDNNE